MVAAAAVVHVTTGLWFAILIGVAIVVLDPHVRRVSIALGVAIVFVGRLGPRCRPTHAGADADGPGMACGRGVEGLTLPIAVAGVGVGGEPRSGGCARQRHTIDAPCAATRPSQTVRSSGVGWRSSPCSCSRFQR